MRWNICEKVAIRPNIRAELRRELGLQVIGCIECRSSRSLIKYQCGAALSSINFAVQRNLNGRVLEDVVFVRQKQYVSTHVPAEEMWPRSRRGVRMY
jgi:hypothetical protein